MGGDSSPPGFHPDTLAPPPPKEDQLVIGIMMTTNYHDHASYF